MASFSQVGLDLIQSPVPECLSELWLDKILASLLDLSVW